MRRVDELPAVGAVALESAPLSLTAAVARIAALDLAVERDLAAELRADDRRSAPCAATRRRPRPSTRRRVRPASCPRPALAIACWWSAPTSLPTLITNVRMPSANARVTASIASCLARRSADRAPRSDPARRRSRARTRSGSRLVSGSVARSRSSTTLSIESPVGVSSIGSLRAVHVGDRVEVVERGRDRGHERAFAVRQRAAVGRRARRIQREPEAHLLLQIGDQAVGLSAARSRAARSSASRRRRSRRSCCRSDRRSGSRSA